MRNAADYTGQNLEKKIEKIYWKKKIENKRLKKILKKLKKYISK